MEPREPEHDVAVSFLAADEALAIELVQMLAGRLRVFVYSERQRELVGREGMSEFTRVFERDSRIVVVLFRDGWGNTPWTGVESTAIQERGFRKGWDFLVFVQVDTTPVPDWLPKTRVRFNFSRFGLAGLAAVVEARFEDAGGTPTIESAIELANRLRCEQDTDARRTHFLASPDGVNAADAEVGTLFDEIEKLATAVREAMPVSSERDGTRSIWLFRAGFTVAAHWLLECRNSLDDSQLTLSVYQGRVGPRRYANLTKPILESERIVNFNVDAARTPFWETRESPPQRFSSRSLADEIVQLALKAKKQS